MFRRASPADPITRPLAYQRWLKAEYARSHKPSPMMTFIGILAAVVLLFICSVPCLIALRVLFQ